MDSGRGRRRMPLISSFWSSSFGLESPHPSMETDLAISPDQWCLPWGAAATPWFNQGPGDPAWEYWTGAGPKQAMNRQLLLCDPRPPAIPLWATLWRTCLPCSSSLCLNEGINYLDLHQKHSLQLLLQASPRATGPSAIRTRGRARGPSCIKRPER